MTMGIAFQDEILRVMPEALLMGPEGYPMESLRALLRAGVVRHLFQDGGPEQRLETVRQCAFLSVELALSLGITVSLFTDPVRRFAPGVWSGEMEAGFVSGGMLGGMMITEPGCGTDLTACETRYDLEAGITGVKHWAGLTGSADYWLVLARDDPPGRHYRLPSLNFYICRADPYAFTLLKRYASAGLRSIPYGRTRLRIREGLIGPLFSGSRAERLRLIHGVLQRSRISIAAIAAGACERLAGEAAAHTRSRVVFGKPLISYEQARARLREVEAARDINRVLFGVACRETARSDASGTEVPAVPANAVKVVSTDLAFAAATSASQLLGGESYRTDLYIGRATSDLRPFRIFEGSNDVLCDALWQAVKKAATAGEPSFAERIRDACETVNVPVPPLDAFHAPETDGAVPQGLRCLGGRMIAQAVCLKACAEANLSPESCAPLAARILRDAHAAATWGASAGLVEY